MASVLPNDSDRVAWLVEQISYLSASHLQLQQVCRVHSDAVVNVLNKADGIEQVQLIQMQSIAERLEALERKPKKNLRQQGAKSKTLNSTYLRHPAMDGPWRRSSGQLGPGKTSMSRPPAPCCAKDAKAAGPLTIADASLTFMPITSPWAACSGNARRGGLGDDECSDLRTLGGGAGRNQKGDGPCSTLEP